MIMCFLKEYSEALMVIITFVYVLATFLIFWVNQKSAKASDELLTETKRQYDETKSRYENEERLRMMPYITFDTGNGTHEHTVELNLWPGLINTQPCLLQLTIKNIGGGTAKNISFFWVDLLNNKSKIRYPILNMLSGEEKKVHFEFYPKVEKPDNLSLVARGEFLYQDLLERDYHQFVSFHFGIKGNTYKLIKYEVEKPEYISKENVDV